MPPNSFGKLPKFENKSQIVNSQKELASVNEALLWLDELSESQLQNPEGRKALGETIDLVFSYVENIEEGNGEVELGIYEAIKKRILAVHEHMCVIKFTGVPKSAESTKFHRDILNIIDDIEIRGWRYLDDIVTYNEQQET